MEIKRFEAGQLLSNGYVIYDHEGGYCWLIDTGYEPDNFIGFVKEKKLNALGIIFTHHHYDHITAGPKVAEALNCDMYIEERDFERAKKTLKDGAARLKAFNAGDEFKAGDIRLVSVLTPGHTKGGVCLVDEGNKLAFTGDTVFAVEIGITNLDDGSPEEMAQSCVYIRDNFADDITIYPGHGPSATMKEVKENNPEFKDALEYAKR